MLGLGLTIVAWLYSYGAIRIGDILSFRDMQNGWTSLICASDNGHFEIVKLLIKCGSDIEHQAKVEGGWWKVVSMACAVDII